MRLYFLRHGSASEVAPSDAERKLRKEGEEEARVAGCALAALGVRPTHIFSSPLVRARHTAEIAAKELKFCKPIEILDELSNETSTPTLLKSLQTHGATDEILAVGHMPSLAEHIAALIGAESPDSLALGKGDVACVALNGWRDGDGQLDWLMRQQQLRAVLP